MASAAATAFGARSPHQVARVLVLVVAALASAALLLVSVGDPVFAGAFLAGVIVTGALLLLARRPVVEEASEQAPPAFRHDVSLLRTALDVAAPGMAVAVTDLEGSVLCVSGAWSQRFGAVGPVELASASGGGLSGAVRRANGSGFADVEFDGAGGPQRGSVVAAEDHLLWRFGSAPRHDAAAQARSLVDGAIGRQLASSGLMALLVDPDGTILAHNPAFALRAAGEEGSRLAGTSLVDHLAASEEGRFHFSAEGRSGPSLRILQAMASDDAESPSLFFLLDDVAGASAGSDQDSHIHALLDTLPLGLALADTDGRFTFINKGFRKAAGLNVGEQPVWPGDLVVDEDKAAVSDAVRRYARGRALSGDLAVRLKINPEEPVAMTVAGARGLGQAAVLLSLKDNSEEARLKREIAQATKMQAVGQLAGGVAHDFNNILTAILGTCDLMLMRHTPGDSDYDDIQQIRSNSNRAANLTRQLLAFSRQQTLRPQVLQLPDVVAEVSHLLTRLLGERIKLEVKHGRGLGAVRADPGQLEQVIVNLAVNARDAMLARDGEEERRLTLQTFSVPAEEVRRLGTDILPVADYTALKVSDTGTGIPPHIIGKIFEPFFTTKEVGKGTGLGLSTVYGIVKQSGGFIFADSKPRVGTSFTIYLPVHRAGSADRPAAAKSRDRKGELWGSGKVLIVEDEAMVRTVAERALTRHGYQVMVAESGEEALEILKREKKFDLMISDVVMPTMDGPTTVRAARALNPDLPILFISGYAEEQLRKSIDIPRVSFLAKPFSVQQLAETVRDTLDGRPPAED